VFFASSVYHLSGVFDSLLLVIARPQLLLLTRPKVDDQLERHLAPQSNDHAIVSDKEHSPEPAAEVPIDGRLSNSTPVTRVISKVSV
jgi:hypothetical protein